ncbi:tRNA methyltransferase ppm2 [Lambiella insularis]|nr:tRNA methyltransferase ppm2 [Lambiella insularis]
MNVSDALPFHMLAKESAICRNAVFVDVDYPALVHKKAAIVKETLALRDLLDQLVESDTPDDIPLCSDQYLAIGCDLRNVDVLDQLLSAELPLRTCSILVVAEVSITYMDTEAADALIAYTSQLGDEVRFCLLEQIIPAGSSHPFAQRMETHFNTLHTPLRSIHKYPNLVQQRRRFADRQWSSISARSLWDLWCDFHFVLPRERSALNTVEPFDEWEDFALFASHYFLLVASNTAKAKTGDREATHIGDGSFFERVPADEEQYTSGTSMPMDSKGTARNYGVLYEARRDEYFHHGGLGAKQRLNTTDVYYIPQSTTQCIDALLPPRIEPRMCHTVTSFPRSSRNASYDCLVVGGRASPDRPFGDCWVYQDQKWERVDDLPTPRYRHCATTAMDADGVVVIVVYGGRSAGGVALNDWLYWRCDHGWASIRCEESLLRPRFGASMTSDEPGSSSGTLLGGMGEDGRIITELWTWSIDFASKPPQIRLSSHIHKSHAMQQMVCRFGASLTRGPDRIYLVGGIPQYGLLLPVHEVVELLSPQPFHMQPMNLLLSTARTVPIPLLVGHTSTWDGRGLVIMGGGALCFSFGFYSNLGVWRRASDGRVEYNPWHLREVQYQMQRDERPSKSLRLTINNKYTEPDVVSRNPTPVLRDRTVRQMESVVQKGEPLVFESLDLGSCTSTWTTEYLKRVIGRQRKVVVHEATNRVMNFQEKNFNYVTKNFEVFIDEIVSGQPQYLRSLSSTESANKAANFEVDYPSIAQDFKVPHELGLVTDNLHSSVLRISGQVTMWLHYDVMANILFQIRGRKRLLLFPPSDITSLEIPHGKSSSRTNIFGSSGDFESMFPNTHPMDVILQPGEALYIPPLWAHTASPTEGVSVAINLFFRNLSSDLYSAGRDVYGNRDFSAYEQGRKDLVKIADRFHRLPPATGKFYLERLAEELREKAAALE